MRQGAILITLLILVHHVGALVHNDAHSDLAIILSMLQKSFIYIGIPALPIIGVVLLWAPYRIIGPYSIMIGMGGGLVLDAYHHYIFESPDHIAHLPEGSAQIHATFIWTTGTLAILEGIGATVTSYLLGRIPRES